ncbi:MAG: PhoH family protein [Desulfopila sp.]
MVQKRKFFILDTNVILHDSTCINHFEEHDIILPITVLEELDGFKKGNQTINYHAREFVRSLDSLSSEEMLNGGMSLGEGKGRLFIRLEREMHDDLIAISLDFSKKDHQILNIGYYVSLENADTQVVLVSKDVNLRMKARSVGLLAEDYTTDNIPDPDMLYSGCRYEEHVSAEFLENLYSQSDGVSVTEMGGARQLCPNEFLVLRNGSRSALATFDGSGTTIQRIEKQILYGVVPRNAEQTFAAHALLDPSLPLVTLSGKAGTGKTLLALAAALEERKNYRKIMLTRPIIPLSNKDIGYLPGDIQSKLNPYMQPLHDNLAFIRGQFPEKSEMHQRLHKILEEGKLCIEPLAYMRGRSLDRIYMIVDEAQNLTPHEVKTIITRAGEGTKIVFTGDIYQIDHPYLNSRSNGLSYLINRMQGQAIYAHIDLRKGERSALAELASNLL